MTYHSTSSVSQLAGIIVDSYARGESKHIWFSVSHDLRMDAERCVCEEERGRIGCLCSSSPLLPPLPSPSSLPLSSILPSLPFSSPFFLPAPSIFPSSPIFSSSSPPFLFPRDLRDIGCYIKVIDGCQQLDRETRYIPEHETEERSINTDIVCVLQGAGAPN